MEEYISNKTNSKMKEENRYRERLRSSLKKSSKNPSGNLDASDECADVTVASAPRRVSFAASSTVKPFVNDPEKNTIWDNTYEEEVNNHTDSVNGISIDTFSNIQHNNVTKHQKRPTTHVIEPIKSLESNSMLTQTITESSDMELTCQFNTQNIVFKGSVNESTNSNRTVFQELDMSITCKFNDIILNKENIVPKGIILNEEQSDIDMEFTCQLPKSHENFNNVARYTRPTSDNPSTEGLARKTGNITQFASDMEFTCHSLQKTTNPLVNNHNDIIFNKENILSEKHSVDMEQSAVDMEFTCQFPQKPLQASSKADVSTYLGQPIGKHLSTIGNPQISAGQGASKKTQNMTQLAAEKEFTCHSLNDPKTIVANKENIYSEEVVNRERSAVDMEFTCHFPQMLFYASNEVPASKKKFSIEKANPQVSDPGLSEKVTQFVSNKQLTCRKSAVADLQGNISKKENTCPEKDISGAEKSARNMEYNYCQLPQNSTNKMNVCTGAVPLSENVCAEGITIPQMSHEFHNFTQNPDCQRIFILNKENIVQRKSTSTVNQTAIDMSPQTAAFSCAVTSSGKDSSAKGINSDKSLLHISKKNKASSLLIDEPRTLVDSTLDNETTNKAYFNQLNSNDQLPRSVAGTELTYLIAEDSAQSNKFVPSIKLAETANPTFSNHSDHKAFKEFDDIQMVIDRTDFNMEQNITNYGDVQNAVSILPNKTYDTSGPIATVSMIQDKSYSIGFDIKSIKDITGIDQNCSSDGFKDILSMNKNESILAQECSFVDMSFSPPKVIYSQPMKTNISSIDTTQQLLEATISKLNIPLDDSNEDVRAQQTIEKLHRKGILQYRSPDFDLVECSNLASDYQQFRDKVRKYLEESRSIAKPRRSRLDEEVRRLSLVVSISADVSSSANGSDSLPKYSGDEENNANFIIEIPKTLHEKIIDIFDNTEDHILKLEHNEENYYIFSTFSQAVWFSVELHSDDNRVTEIQSLSAQKDGSRCLFPALNDFIVKHTRSKLEMSNLRSCLGNHFDMLSLLDHVNMITEKSFEFYIEFTTIQRHYYKTLEIDIDGTVSFEILVKQPAIWWTIQFTMASLESIQHDSLRVMSKWGNINEQHIKTIIINIEPGIDCIRRFIQEVIEYFKRVQMRKLK